MPQTQNNYFLVIKHSLCLTGCLVIGSLQDKHLLLHLAIVWQQQEISIAHKSDLILTRSQLTLASLLSLLSLFFKVLFSLKHKCSPSTISIASIHRVEFSIWQKSGRSLFLKFLMLTKKRRGKKKKPSRSRSSAPRELQWKCHCQPVSLGEVKHHCHCWNLTRTGHINVKSREDESGMTPTSRKSCFSWRWKDSVHVGAHKHDLGHFWICITTYKYFLIVRRASVNPCW